MEDERAPAYITLREEDPHPCWKACGATTALLCRKEWISYQLGPPYPISLSIFFETDTRMGILYVLRETTSPYLCLPPCQSKSQRGIAWQDMRFYLS
jgi:hypothetical protein